MEGAELGPSFLVNETGDFFRGLPGSSVTGFPAAARGVGMPCETEFHRWAERTGTIGGGRSAPVKGNPLIFNLVLASLQGEPCLSVHSSCCRTVLGDPVAFQ